ncbi:hypothetical protein GF323_01605 [Candidatus Woesearchaeota archaeon]|nr:hypothetical protein [Candidatus Woesearchaeota archaeon]
MACKNCYAAGALAPSDYSILSHGDIGAFYNSIVHADLPKYTAKMYYPKENEIAAEFKYDRIKFNYDTALKEIRDSAQGLPFEAYIPKSMVLPDNTSASPSVTVRNPEVMPKKEAADEIQEALSEVKGSVIIRTTEIEQELHLKRKLRKVEIIRREKHEDN